MSMESGWFVVWLWTDELIRAFRVETTVDPGAPGGEPPGFSLAVRRELCPTVRDRDTDIILLEGFPG